MTPRTESGYGADALERIRGGVVVSSQAMDPRSPLSPPHILSLLAQAAELGGAAGFRVESRAVVEELRPRTRLPIIGIRKHRVADTDTYITPSAADAVELIASGADIVAAQATSGSRPFESFAEIANAVHAAGRLVMADIATAEEANEAAAAGADLIATTMVGYTRESKDAVRPPLALVERLTKDLSVPVVVEGGIWTADDVTAAFAVGAWCVVVGSAVTAPDLITRRLVDAASAHRRS
jgi:N-acylglucosamine-6-phosphate 2-epimerase